MPQEQMPETQVRERLAEYAHEAWSGWMKWMFGKSLNLSNGEVVIPANLVQRWKRQVGTPYANLEEYEKDSDRAEADKMLAILPASREVALQERLERAEGLLKEAQTLLNDAVKNGCLILGRCELDSRISSFLHDGEVKP